MTRIEQIKAEIKRIQEFPCGDNDTETWNMKVAIEDELKEELRGLITKDIPLSRLEEICEAERNGVSKTQLPISLTDLENMKGQEIHIVPFPEKFNPRVVPVELLVPMVGRMDEVHPFAVGNDLTFWLDTYGKQWVAYKKPIGVNVESLPVNLSMAAKALSICGHSVGLHACGEDVCVRGAYMDAYLASAVLSDLIERGYLAIQLKNDPNDKYLVTRTDYLNRLLESVEWLKDEEKDEDDDVFIVDHSHDVDDDEDDD